MIRFERQGGLIHLSNDHISLVLEIREEKLLHVYFGRRLSRWLPVPDKPGYRRSYATEHEGFSRPFDETSFEYPEFGQGDFREDALSLLTEDTGCDFHDFRVADIQILDSLLQPAGMPGIQGDGKTLSIRLFSRISGLELTLQYGINETFAGVFRFQTLHNRTDQIVRIRKLARASLDLPARPWTLLSLAGTHLREGSRQVTDLPTGKVVLDSTRGSSSAQHPPFLALCDGAPEWDHGEIAGCALLYSGSHAEIVEKDYYAQVRLTAGLHPGLLDWPLEPGETFCTPQCVLSFTEGGLNAMAQNFHRLFLDHLFRKGEAGVLLNSWESFYYDTTSTNIVSLAESARELGIDLLVIDDGWFRTENSSRAPIGDWEVNRKKFPEGLPDLLAQIRKQGLAVGLWFEPEAVSPNSRLFKAHPDWILHLPGVDPVQGRHEYLLNLGLPEVQNHVMHMLDAFLSCGLIRYIKWDMNRPLTDVRKSQDSHRYILGLYRILRHLNETWPELVIEGCSSGGCRLDPGILACVHQNWVSDNTDPFDRVDIQSGLALFLPPVKLTAHVSASPNHQTGRTSRLQDRYEVTRFFNPGYELDPSKLSAEELARVKEQVKEIHEEAAWMKETDFFQGDGFWARTDQNRNRAEVLVFQPHFAPDQARRRLRLPFLNQDAIYRILPDDICMTGEQIARYGIGVPVADHDCQVLRFSLREEESQ